MGKAEGDRSNMNLQSSSKGNGRCGQLLRGNPAWQKSVSGNPAGRPKNEPLLSPQIRRQLHEVCPADPEGRTWPEVLAERMLQLACQGNPAAIKELLDRIDGKVTENVQLDTQLKAIQNMTDQELGAFIAATCVTETEQSG